MTTPDPGTWLVVLADGDNSIITDPGERAKILTDEYARGTISIRRRAALPDEHGQLPGTWQSLDIFGEIDLDEIDVEYAEELWRLMIAAAEGMNRAARAEQPETFEEAAEHILGETDDDRHGEPSGPTRCPRCETLPIGHEGDCEPPDC